MARLIVVGALALSLVGAMGFVFGDRAGAGPEDCTPSCGPSETCACRCETTGATCDPSGNPGCNCVCGCEDSR